MYGGLDSQLFLGNREWYILDEGRELNKPVIMKQKKEDDQKNRTNRRPSEIQDNLIDSENVVGLMGDDEDIQQAQYNVMSMIDERLDEYNGDIKEKLNTSINNRLTEIENMLKEINTERYTTFDEVNELRRITEQQIGIMSNVGILIDDDGLQNDIHDLNDLVFDQYSNLRESVRSNLNVVSPPSPIERDEHYGKIRGETYYSTTNNIYDKYTEFPYYLNIDSEWFKNKSAEKLKCESNEDGYCKTQPDNLYCNGSPENPIKAFKRNDKEDSCTLSYDPQKKIYKCGDLEFQDSLYPLASVLDDFRECVEPIIYSYTVDKIISLIVIIILYIILFKIQFMNDGEEFHLKSFGLSLVISFIYIAILFEYPVSKAPIYDYFYMMNIPYTDFKSPITGKPLWARGISTFLIFPFCALLLGGLTNKVLL